MDRKSFIKNCGLACLSLTSISTLLQGCAGSYIITLPMNEERIIVPLHHFEFTEDKKKMYRQHIIVKNEQLQFPICIYRFSEKEYTAIYMRCTHQGAELRAYGDTLVCYAHGSEFDNKGNVQNPPANKPLVTFPIIAGDKELSITLKKV